MLSKRAALLQTGTSEPLSPEEIARLCFDQPRHTSLSNGRCRDAVRAYVASDDPEAALLLGDVRKIAEAFRCLKVCVQRCVFVNASF